MEGKASPTAFDRYALALVCYRAADFDSARRYLEASVAEDRKFYSLTALALLLTNVYGEHAAAYLLVKEAAALAPEDVTVAVKLGEIAIRAGEHAAFVAYFDAAPAAIRAVGRMQMYMGQCLVELDETERAKDYIHEGLVVADFKEGEYSVSGIWCNLYRREMARERGCAPTDIPEGEVLSAHPLPYLIDFRMH